MAACKKNNLSKIPQISFIALTPDSVQQGSGSDTAFIVFHLTDGDADLGRSDGKDIYIIDSRFPDSLQTWAFPAISSDAEDADKGISGTCVFAMYSAFIQVRDDSVHHVSGDTLHYELYIKDRAGNESNHITTPNLYLTP